MAGSGEKRFKTFQQQHPLLKEVIAALQEGKGPPGLSAERKKLFKSRCQEIHHPAEAWMLAEDLVALAYHLDVEKGAKAAAKEVLTLVSAMTVTLKSILSQPASNVGDQRRDKARKFLGDKPAKTPRKSEQGKGESLLSLRAKRR